MDKLKDKIVIILVLAATFILLALVTIIFDRNKIINIQTVMSKNEVDCIINCNDLGIEMSPECACKIKEICTYLSYFEPKLSDSEYYTKIIENNDTGLGTIIVYDNECGYVKIILTYQLNNKILTDINYSYINSLYKWNYTPCEELIIQERG